MDDQGKNNAGVVMGEVCQPLPQHHPYYGVPQGYAVDNTPSAPPTPSYQAAPPPRPPCHQDPPPPPPPQSQPQPSAGVATTNIIINNNAQAPRENVTGVFYEECVVEGYPTTLVVQESPLCCGIGVGWLLFILGWFLCGIPWYAGAIILFFSKDRREKAGYTACLIFAVIVTIVAIIMKVKAHN